MDVAELAGAQILFNDKSNRLVPRIVRHYYFNVHESLRKNRSQASLQGTGLLICWDTDRNHAHLFMSRQTWSLKEDKYLYQRNASLLNASGSLPMMFNKNTAVI